MIAWEVQWGGYVEFLETVVAASLGHTPDALLNKPELMEGLEDEKFAFNALAGSRPPARIIWPIPVSEILGYARDMHIYDKERFLILMIGADEAYREALNGHNTVYEAGLPGSNGGS